MKIFLIGFMGSGKSTTGKKLAQELSFEFLDLDEALEKRMGLSIPQLFNEGGEAFFRLKEHETLLEIVKKEGDFVISTGGGTPCFNNNMSIINNSGISVYLYLTPELLAARLDRSKIERPLIKGKKGTELVDFISQKLHEREEWYSQSMHTVSGRGDAAKNIVALLR